MSIRFEEHVILHCAATLAGHKCASLFSYQEIEGESLKDNLNALNQLLQGKGVCARLLRESEKGGLVYVYRPTLLEKRLNDPEICAFLRAQGYEQFGLEEALATLSAHIRQGDEFPHEIGVFLGYPLGDVVGFIEHKGSNFCCMGPWKAYGNKEEALRLFALYRKCRDVYLSCYRRGFGMNKLTVAA